MAFVITSHRGASVPPRWPFTIAWDRAEATGLVAAYPLLDLTASLDLITARTGAWNGSPVYAGSAYGLVPHVINGTRHIEIPNPEIGVESSFTICLRIYPIATLAGDIFGKWVSFGSTAVKQVLIRNGGPQCFVRDNDDIAEASATGPGTTVGQWNHIVFRGDGTDISVWVDGVSGTPVSFAGPYIPPDTSVWAIGDGHSGTGAANLYASDVRIYRRALSDAEIVSSALASPWDIYHESGRRTYFIPAAAGGGATVPIFHHHYNQMRAA